MFGSGYVKTRFEIRVFMYPFTLHIFAQVDLLHQQTDVISVHFRLLAQLFHCSINTGQPVFRDWQK